MFISALFILGKIWKLMFISRWTEKEYMVYMYNGILFRLKKEKILKFVTTQGNLENIMLSEINQTENEKYWKILYDITYIWTLEKQN